MLIVAYVVNDILIRNVNTEGTGAMTTSGIILIVSTLLLTSGNITWIVLQYIWFTGFDCTFNVWQMTFTCIAGIAMYVIVLFRTRNDASIFTSSIVLCYNLYLQWSALSSNPYGVCNPYTTSAGNTTFEIIAGLIFTFISLLTISSQTSKEGEVENVATAINAPMMEKETEEDVKIAEENEKLVKDGKKPESKPLPITTATIIF